MSTIYRQRDDESWPDRFRMLTSMAVESHGGPLLNPEELVCNVICNSCGRVAAGTIDHPPEGWHLGRFGENDYCPACRV